MAKGIQHRKALEHHQSTHIKTIAIERFNSKIEVQKLLVTKVRKSRLSTAQPDYRMYWK